MKNIKLYPDNCHMNYYKDWLFLGNDGRYDYYYMFNTNGSFIADNHMLSIVGSNEPDDYLSPSLECLSQAEKKLKNSPIPSYKTMYKMLIENKIIEG